MLAENILQSIVKLLSISTVKKNLDKFADEIEHDPEIQANIDIIKKNYAEIELKLKWFCKYRPNHSLCKGLKDK